MKDEDLIRLARQTGATPYTNRHYPDQPTHTFTIEQLREFARLVQQPAPQPLTETVDWEHIARLLDAALQELVVFVDERWSDNECRPLENAKHAMGLVKDEW